MEDTTRRTRLQVVAVLLAASCAAGGTPRILSAQDFTEPVPSCESLVQSLGLTPAASMLVSRSLELHGGMVVRWPEGRAPLAVWIRPPLLVRRAGSRTAPETDHVDLAVWTWAVVSALEHWKGLTARVEFAVARDSSSADVHVTWVARLPPLPNTRPSRTAGRSAVERDASSGVVVAARISFAQMDRDFRPFSPEDVHAVAVHEIGHVLGLAHHDEGESVMNTDVRSGQITAADRAALEAWYSLPLGQVCHLGRAP